MDKSNIARTIEINWDIRWQHTVYKFKIAPRPKPPGRRFYVGSHAEPRKDEGIGQLALLISVFP